MVSNKDQAVARIKSIFAWKDCVENYTLDQAREAVRLADQYLEPSDGLLWQSVSSLAHSARVKGLFEEAEVNFRRILEYNLRTKGICNAYGTFGDIAYCIYGGRGVAAAEAYLQDAITVVRRECGIEQEMRLTTVLGNIYDRDGQFGKALVCIKKLLAFKETKPDRMMYTIIKRVAGLHEKLGQFQEALTEHLRALDVHSDVPDEKRHEARVRSVFILSNIGNTLFKLGRLTEARRYLEEAIELDAVRPRAKSNYSLAMFRRNLAAVALAEGHRDEARTLLELAINDPGLLLSRASPTRHPEVDNTYQSVETLLKTIE